MNLVLPGLVRLRAELPPLAVLPEAFASADETPEDAAKVQRWKHAAAITNIALLRRVLQALPSTHTARVPAALLDALLVRVTQCPPEALLSCDSLQWLRQCTLALSDSRASVDRFLHHLIRLPLLFPALLREYPGVRVPIPPMENLWPVAWRLGIRARSTPSTLYTSRQGEVWLTHPGGRCRLIPNKRHNPRSGLVFLRHTVPGTTLEVCPPMAPYHAVWAHKFQNSRPVAFPRILRSVQTSLSILSRAWPQTNGLTPYAQRLIVYVSRDPSLHNSASTDRFPFVQYLNVSPGQELENLTSILHEAMHSKLAVLMTATSLHNNGKERRFRHPWMRIPRPADGVLLGAHAFINIMSLASQVRVAIPELEESAERILRRRRDEVARALDECQRISLTAAGRAVVEAMFSTFTRLQQETP